jgi:hypothetical protein
MEARLVLSTPVVNPADPAAFAETQAAVDAAAPGDVIKVNAGSYGPVTISKDDLTIRGGERGLRPGHRGHGVPVADSIGANGLTSRGLEARNAPGTGTSSAASRGMATTTRRSATRQLERKRITDPTPPETCDRPSVSAAASMRIGFPPRPGRG